MNFSGYEYYTSKALCGTPMAAVTMFTAFFNLERIAMSGNIDAAAWRRVLQEEEYRLSFVRTYLHTKLDDLGLLLCEEGANGCVSEGIQVVAVALKVLGTSSPWLKALITLRCGDLWKKNQIVLGADYACAPERPSRDDTVEVVAAGKVPKRGKGGTLASRQALIHSLVHIEAWAIDLAWDAIARFGSRDYLQANGITLPKKFYEDFLQVAIDESVHFSLLCYRLEEMGSFYGAFAAHDGLWESASMTSHDCRARFAIEHAVHEARGLDILPHTIERLRKGDDRESADLLQEVILEEEISHCRAGVEWFRYVSRQVLGRDLLIVSSAGEDDEEMIAREFHSYVRKYFHGKLKQPFNEVARAKAGFPPIWYMPLAE